MSEWTDDLKADVIKRYEAANPTPETSMDIVADIAEALDTTVNGTRMILSRANVYIKKTPAKSSAASATSGEKKESKADSIARLTKVIKSMDIEVDESITSKMTGKAAAYFADTITSIVGTDESA